MNIVVTTFHLATVLDCYLVCFFPSTLLPWETLMEVITHYRRHCSKDHWKLKPPHHVNVTIVNFGESRKIVHSFSIATIKSISVKHSKKKSKCSLYSRYCAAAWSKWWGSSPEQHSSDETSQRWQAVGWITQKHAVTKPWLKCARSEQHLWTLRSPLLDTGVIFSCATYHCFLKQHGMCIENEYLVNHRASAKFGRWVRCPNHLADLRSEAYCYNFHSTNLILCLKLTDSCNNTDFPEFSKHQARL